jgi:hypothetical protein
MGGEWSVANIPKSVRRKWPVGPHYVRWVDGKGVHAWARFKVKSADWYIRTLEITAREAGDVDRYVGIEMALDGALSSLCGAVDAAGWGLLELVETLEVRDDLGDHSQIGGDWRGVFTLARASGIVLSSEFAALDALKGSGSNDPTGWLAQLRLLRDAAVRHNELVRQFDVDGKQSGRLIDVPGRGPSPTIEYLKAMRKRTNGLVELILADITDASKRTGSSGDGNVDRRDGPRPLPELSDRAGVQWPPARTPPTRLTGEAE